MKKLLFGSMLLVAMLTLAGCGSGGESGGGAPGVSVTGIVLNKTTIAIPIVDNHFGGTEQLTATILPANSTNQNVTWSTSDDTIATVSSSGLVTTVADGKATITVTTADGNKAATCMVTISAVTVTGTLKGWELNGSNTGLAGVGLTPSDLTLYTEPVNKWSNYIIVPAGSVITRKIIDKLIDVSAGNIIIESCLIRPTYMQNGMPLILSNELPEGTPHAGSVIIRNCDIDGLGISNLNSRGMALAFAGVNTFIKNCKINDIGSGLNLGGDLYPTGAEGNYIYNLVAGVLPDGSGSHIDGVTIRSYGAAEAAYFKNNRIVCNNLTNTTGSMYFHPFMSGRSIDNVLIEGNLLEGAGYNLVIVWDIGGYGTNMRAINNRFVTTQWGTGYVQGGPGWAEWRDNYLNDPSKPDNKGAELVKPMP